MHRLKHTIPVFIILLLVVLSACEKFNKEEEIPAYVRFMNPRVQLDAAGFTSSTGIKTLWLYQGGFLQGTYQVLPVTDTNWLTIPVLSSISNDLVLEGGMYESGQSSFHLPHPFWKKIEITPNLVPGETLYVDTKFEYGDATDFNLAYYEDFEASSIAFDAFASSVSNWDSTFFRTISSDLFHGSFTGYVPIGPSDQYFEVLNTTFLYLVRENDSYAEITYKNSIEFQVGLFYETPSELGIYPIITITPSSEWNTIYIHLSETVRYLVNTYGTQIAFKLWLKAGGEGQSGFINFDDIRVLTNN